MALVATDLCYIAGGGTGPRLWSYRTADAKAMVDTAAYFNTFVKQLLKGDIIFAHTSYGGTSAFGVFVVLDNDGTDVDVGDLVLLNSADTD